MAVPEKHGVGVPGNEPTTFGARDLFSTYQTTSFGTAEEGQGAS
jgi:hypothetical protein